MSKSINMQHDEDEDNKIFVLLKTGKREGEKRTTDLVLILLSTVTINGKRKFC